MSPFRMESSVEMRLTAAAEGSCCPPTPKIVLPHSDLIAEGVEPVDQVSAWATLKIIPMPTSAQMGYPGDG